VQPTTPTAADLELVVVRETEPQGEEFPKQPAEEPFDARRRLESSGLCAHDAEHRRPAPRPASRRARRRSNFGRVAPNRRRFPAAMKPEKDWLSFALLALTVLGMALVALAQ